MPAVGSHYTTVRLRNGKSIRASQSDYYDFAMLRRAGQEGLPFNAGNRFRERILLRIIRAKWFLRQICESRSLELEARETRVIRREIVQSDTERIYDYHVDVINRRLVMFHFATRVNVAALLIIDQVRSVMRKKRVFYYT